ncbi:kinase-like domain-containing protein [Chytriomyces cf. hyalinus JEL632]|nr:kinase-like domain-containing protein [Chytriomyces cf. hyalinus JEL632]
MPHSQQPHTQNEPTTSCALSTESDHHQLTSYAPTAIREITTHHTKLHEPSNEEEQQQQTQHTATAAAAKWHGLNSEQRARVAVLNAFRYCPSAFLETYVIHRVIGFGSNGVVLAAESTVTGECVAIKVIYKKRQGRINDPLPSEIVLLKELCNVSQFILRYVDCWQDVNHYYMVTELFGNNWNDVYSANNSELHPIILRSMNSEMYVFSMAVGCSDLYSWSFAYRCKFFNMTGYSMLPMKPIKFIVRQIAAALYHLHKRGYYHGDIKQENILVQLPDAPQSSDERADVDRPRIRLADFGHARLASLGCARYGTRATSAPEFSRASLFHGNELELDGRCGDVFALGLILYSLLGSTGELPSSDCMEDDIPDLEEAAWELLDGMCCPDPAKRVKIDQVLVNEWLSE